MPDSQTQALQWIAKEALRSAIHLWPPLANRALRLRVVPTGESVTIRTTLGKTPSDEVIDLTLTRDEVPTLLNIEAQRELGARLGRWYVYDLGLADGV